MKFRLLCLLFTLLLPINTFALYEITDSRCTTDMKISLREKAINVTYKLNKIVNKKVTYEIQLLNIDEDMYIVDSFTNNKYTIKNNKIENITPGLTVNLDIYASNNNYCEGYKMTTKIVNIPYYNKYSSNELCKGYETYILCKETSNINIDEKEFNTRMKSYINSLKQEDNTKKEELEKKEVQNNGFDFITFLTEYNLYISLFLVIILTILIVIIINDMNKKRGII